MNKLQKFQSFIYSKNFDLFCVTESWLHESIHDNEILPSDYTRNDRGERGGGVLVAIKNTVTSKLILKHNTVELLTIQVNLSPCLLLVCLTFHPIVLKFINKKFCVILLHCPLELTPSY